jgi:hypothetical protein
MATAQPPDVVLQNLVFHTFFFGQTGRRNRQICCNGLVQVEEMLLPCRVKAIMMNARRI